MTGDSDDVFFIKSSDGLFMGIYTSTFSFDYSSVSRFFMETDGEDSSSVILEFLSLWFFK